MDDNFYPASTSQREIAIRQRVRRLADFYRHVFVFVMVMTALWLLNALQIYLSEKQIKWYSWWAIWPTIGWGIGVLSHGLTTVPTWNFFSHDWEERKVKELLEREQR
jgi:hypothetical protein